MTTRWTLPWIVILLAGCAGHAGTLTSEYRLGDGDTAVGIGRMEAMRAPDSRSVSLTDGLKGRGVLSVMQHAADGSEVPYAIKTADEDYGSDFYVALPPGRYRIVGWQHGEFEARLNGWFDVPPRGVVYIGTLRWNDRGRDGLLSRRGRWTLHDELDEVAARFRARFPAVDAVVRRSFITVKPSEGVSASP